VVRRSEGGSTAALLATKLLALGSSVRPCQPALHRERGAARLAAVGMIAGALLANACASPADATMTVQQPIGWSLVQVGADHRALQLSSSAGGCADFRTVHAVTSETRRSIRIEVVLNAVVPSFPGDQLLCPSNLVTGPVFAHLRRPVAGRPVRGPRPVKTVPSPPFIAAQVPRVVGLDLRDATLALRQQGFAVRARRTATLARVARQSPGAGTHAEAPAGAYPVRLTVR
jgi:hypothetical protein